MVAQTQVELAVAVPLPEMVEDPVGWPQLWERGSAAGCLQLVEVAGW